MSDHENERVHCRDCGCDLWDHNTGSAIALLGGCGSCGDCEGWR